MKETSSDSSDYFDMCKSINSIEIQPKLRYTEKTESSFPSFRPARPGQSHPAVFQSKLQNFTIAAMKRANTYLPIGSVLPAVDAVDWSQPNCDVRPRLLDRSTGLFRLIDSGSMITAAMKRPEDKPDKNIRLVAVNGSEIKTYGVREIDIKIGRKSYKMPAVVCDIAQDILGMDFIDKYKLGFEWDDFDQSELYLVDKRANIKEELQIVTVPSDLQRVSYLVAPPVQSSESADLVKGFPPKSVVVLGEPRDNQAVSFEVACMQNLDKSVDPKGLEIHDEKYIKMVKKYPQLLKTTYSKEEPVHGVYHKIHTSDHPPCRAKRRPLPADSAKSEAGRKVWEKMIEDGII